MSTAITADANLTGVGRSGVQPGSPAGESALAAVARRLLGVLARVEPGETLGVLLLTANVFTLLTTYYLLKTVREPLILLGGGAEVKSYAAAGQALLLIPFVKGFSKLSQMVGRLRLAAIVTGFFASNLVVFFVLGRAGVPLGVPFYLWVGVFNVSAVAQFWGFAADLYAPEQGKRLFAIIGVGSSLGATFGARLARILFASAGPFGLMLVAAGGLFVALGLTALAHRSAERSPVHRPPPAQPLAPGGGFALVASDRYLQLVALFVVLINVVNTTGEYVLDRTVLAAAAAQTSVAVPIFVTAFKARYFEAVNLLGMVLQLFVVSRVYRYVGVRGALLVVPVIAMAGYGALAIAPILPLVFAAKVAENGLDYSLQNTTRQTLFLPTSREAKYKAKAVIDTFLVRTGDVLSAAIVWLGHHFALAPKRFALMNTVLVLGWLAVARSLGGKHEALARSVQESSAGRTT
jgi:AAA family ATP:ADP antiporter